MIIDFHFFLLFFGKSVKLIHLKKVLCEPSREQDTASQASEWWDGQHTPKSPGMRRAY